MRHIMRKFKKWMLKSKIKSCDLRLIELDELTDMYHEIILDEIMNKKDKSRIARLKQKRDELVEQKLQLISDKYNYQKQLSRAY